MKFILRSCIADLRMGKFSCHGGHRAGKRSDYFKEFGPSLPTARALARMVFEEWAEMTRQRRGKKTKLLTRRKVKV